MVHMNKIFFQQVVSFIVLILSATSVLSGYLYFFPPVNFFREIIKYSTPYYTVIILFIIPVTIAICFIIAFFRQKAISLILKVVGTLAGLCTLCVIAFILYGAFNGNLDPEWPLGLMTLVGDLFMSLVVIGFITLVLLAVEYILNKLPTFLRLILMIVLFIWIAFCSFYVMTDYSLFSKKLPHIVSNFITTQSATESLNISTDEKIKKLEDFYRYECLGFYNKSYSRSCRSEIGAELRGAVNELQEAQSCQSEKTNKCLNNKIWQYADYPNENGFKRISFTDEVADCPLELTRKQWDQMEEDAGNKIKGKCEYYYNNFVYTLPVVEE